MKPWNLVMGSKTGLTKKYGDSKRKATNAIKINILI
jgi:hypothetical protein